MARLEVSPQSRPFTKAAALFFKGLKEMGGDDSKVRAFCVKLHTSFSVGGDVPHEGEGHAEEGWVIDMHVVSTICTDFKDAFFLKRW